MRHGGGGPAQLLGGTGGEVVAAETFCAGGHCVCDRFNLCAGSGRSAGGRIAEGASSSSFLCWTDESSATTDCEPAGAAWGAILPGVSEERRHREGTSAVES